MHKITFFQLGNADTTRIDLANGRKILVDYAATRSGDAFDKRADLPALLRSDLAAAKRDYYDVAAFTHHDKDHTIGAGEFFHLEHAGKYQGNGRIKIRTLWVSAATIIESRDDLRDDAKLIQAEARHRLIKGEGIRVFSRPQPLKDWLEARGVKFEDRKHLITDAGQLAPEFSLIGDGLEIFIHSPFVSTLNDSGVLVRNDEALVFQARFKVGSQITDALMMADVKYDVIENIVEITKDHRNENRLKWDIMGISHHSSYLSLSAEKGKDKTTPTDLVRELLEKHGQQRSVLVSTSDPIPSRDSDQPPHRQAAAYYRDVANIHGGRYIVTMEYPNKTDPKPLVIHIDENGHTVENPPSASGTSAATETRPPRAG